MFVRISTNAAPDVSIPLQTLKGIIKSFTRKLACKSCKSHEETGHHEGESVRPQPEKLALERNVQTEQGLRCSAWERHGKHPVLCLGGPKTGLVPPH